jgi:methionyl aminopeptidase
MSTLDRGALREGGRITAHTLQVLADAVTPGITTGELDALARETIEDAGAIPAFLGMYGFPGSVCISINEEVVHGIPGERKLEKGDIVSLDLGAKVNGWFTDSAFGKAGSGAEFASDMALAIEPMVVNGSPEVRTLGDNWTVATRDRSLAAHYEETVIVTDGEPERITPLPDVLQARNAGDRLGKVAGQEPARSDMKDPHHG